MIRITKATDYGILLLSHFARRSEEAVLNAKDLSAMTHIPLPMVTKILKTLAHAQLLDSHRGSRGGYVLKRRPQDISLTQVIHAIEGPVSLTECAEGPGVCSLETMCPVQSNWMRINQAIQHALSGITLAQIAHPMSHCSVAITGVGKASCAAEGAPNAVPTSREKASV